MIHNYLLHVVLECLSAHCNIAHACGNGLIVHMLFFNTALCWTDNWQFYTKILRPLMNASAESKNILPIN